MIIKSLINNSKDTTGQERFGYSARRMLAPVVIFNTNFKENKIKICIWLLHI